MADKQPQLNGAYYGPAIPPQQERERYPYRPSRDRSCCRCLFGFLWKLLLALIVIAGLAILIFWLVVQPRSFKFYVSDAQLTQFEYNTTTLHYNLALNFTARNPNKKLSIYYDKVEGRAFYDGDRFGSADVITHMNSFRQYKKSTNGMSGEFKGQKVLPSLDQSRFNNEKNNNAFDIDVDLHFRIRFRLGDVKSGDYHPKATCELKNIPLISSSNTTTTGFQLTKCDVDFF